MARTFLPALGVGSLGLLATAASMDVSAAQSASPTPASAESQAAPARCSGLLGKQIAGAIVDKADFITAGSGLPPMNIKSPADFCLVDAKISPVAGSEIKIQIWLPAKWNGKFVGAGGGGFEGGYGAAFVGLRRPLAKGYAGVVTNAGHDPAPEPKWALGNPQKIVDYGYRANHLGAVVGKAAVREYYGAPAKRAYFQGCSNGGRDALMLAQRYPDDYDAIAVGAPANDFTGLMAAFVQTEQWVRQPGIDLSAAKLKRVNQAAIKLCDSNDGLSDGLIDRPQSCRFDPAVLQCKLGEKENCLTSSEVGVVKAIYRGHSTSTGGEVMPGLPVGSEYEWANWLTGPKAAGAGLGLPFFGYMVHQDAGWTMAKFDFGRDYAAAQKQLSPIIDAKNPDLRPFLRKGGRLLMYHGWDDAAIPAGNTLRYYAAMKQATGRLAADRTRLFMLPGVAHCAGGNGPDILDYFGELDRWTESGIAPEQVVATKYDSLISLISGAPVKVLRTRPICAWPKSARYKGVGSPDEAANFVCG